MHWFLLIFLTIYGGMHAGVFWRFYTAFPGLGRWRWAAVPVLLLLALAPMIVRTLERRDLAVGKVGACIAFTWMAIIFWLFCYCFLMDAIAFSLWAVRVVMPKWNVPTFPPFWRFVIPAGITAISLIWGMIEVRTLRVPHLTCQVPALPDGRTEVKLMLITDVHLGSMVGREKLAQIAAVADREHPDIIVSTGDLADGTAQHLEDAVPALQQLRPPLGKYAVTGNHEFYTGLDKSLAFHEAAGFKMLRAEAVALGEHQELVIAGVDDPAGRSFGSISRTDETAALAAAAPDRAVILLKHRPRVAPESVDKFDLQLSGHVHGGQIFPFVIFVAMDYGHLPGYHRISDRSAMYVSRGTGTWGPKLRVLAPPEITIITLQQRP